LFEIVTPTNAYFEKDFQQLQIVKKNGRKKYLEVNVKGCAISENQTAL
jgi:pantothenate synthetase